MTSVFTALADRFSDDELTYLETVLAGPEPFLTPEFIKEAAHEILLYRAFEPAEQVAKRRHVICVRADTRLRAKAGRALGQGGVRRSQFSAQDVKVTGRQMPYSKFFGLEDIQFSHPKYTGGYSDTVDRATFVMADAVTVLPYDPKRQRVLVVEQFRAAPYVRGDQKPWILEPIAGRIDPGETPESTAHREAIEEANITFSKLHCVSGYYPSPGAATEYIWSYVGIADLPDDCVGVSGLETEDEDIASQLISVDDFLDLADQGALDTGPLMVTALWLARHKDRL
ncbi:NUDIX domain-containing protein [Pacificibacter maritimus]|nr:NUDIX domain-containing protein [Pacificibacter maritimus]